jgi:hypothetical protein
MQDYVPHRSAQSVKLNYNEGPLDTSKWRALPHDINMDNKIRAYKRFVGNRSRDYRLADRNFMQSRGGIPELPPDIWRKIMPIHYPTLVAMRNVSRGLRDIVNAMIESFRPGVEILEALMTGRKIRRAVQTTRKFWPRLGQRGSRQYLTTDHVRQVHTVVDAEDRSLIEWDELVRTLPRSLLRTTRDQRQHNRTWV